MLLGLVWRTGKIIRSQFGEMICSVVNKLDNAVDRSISLPIDRSGLHLSKQNAAIDKD